ncbi:MAG: hypothetical protein FJ388_22395, partial [Verrucomicrobia bacterium]|nr:hypothetical protein [Verrucomicrobiota bacterium]
GGIPRPDAHAQIGNVRLTVQRVAKNRIVELRLERPTAEGA